MRNGNIALLNNINLGFIADLIPKIYKNKSMIDKTNKTKNANKNT